MARTLYCRHDRCGETVDVVAGLFPPICPGCGKDSRWSTTPGNIVKPRAHHPRVQFDLTENDRRLLKRHTDLLRRNNDADDDSA